MIPGFHAHPNGPTLPLYTSIVALIEDISSRFRIGAYTWLEGVGDFGGDPEVWMALDRAPESRARGLAIDPSTRF